MKKTASKKNQARKSSAPTKAQLRAQLARDIVAVLSNPECPQIIYNDLADAVLDVFNHTSTARLDTSVAYTQAILDEYAATKEEGSVR
jgi:hypothetical protein